jgi:hypothetical protein
MEIGIGGSARFDEDVGKYCLARQQSADTMSYTKPYRTINMRPGKKRVDDDTPVFGASMSSQEEGSELYGRIARES